MRNGILCAPAKRSRSLNVTSDGCVQGRSFMLSSFWWWWRLGGGNHWPFTRASFAHRSTSSQSDCVAVSEMEREKKKRILIAQSFFSWMNIDSHWNPPKKKCPVNRLTMKSHFFLFPFPPIVFDLQTCKKADRSARKSTLSQRARPKMKRSFFFGEKWFHTKSEWIVN